MSGDDQQLFPEHTFSTGSNVSPNDEREMSVVLSGDNANCSDVISRIATNDEGRHNDCVRQLSGVFIALQALAHSKRRRCFHCCHSSCRLQPGQVMHVIYA